MLFELFKLIVGTAILIVGAEFLVRGSRSLALRFGISTLVVGLTVVAFGTSAPELFVSVAAAMEGTADVAIGNIIGSNLFNFLIIIGVTTLLAPVTVAKQLSNKEIPTMLLSMGMMVLFGMDQVISRAEGVILFIGLCGYLLSSYLSVRKDSKQKALQESDIEKREEGGALSDEALEDVGQTPLVSLLCIIGGLIGLVIGAQLIVGSAVFIAREIGISELIIGVTLVAAGTSLPELATTVMAAKQGEPDLAVGNAVGSNIFNVLCVIGLTAMVQPLRVAQSAISFDLPFMLMACFIFWPIICITKRIGKFFGISMLAVYLSYIVFTFCGV